VADLSDLKGVGTQIGTAIQGGLTQANSQLQQLETNLNRLRSVGGSGGIAQLGHQISSAFSPLQKVSGFISGIESGFIRLNFAMEGIERVGRAVYTMFSKPFDALMTSTEDARKFELAISGVTGGMEKARAVNSALLSDLKNIPLSLEEVRRLTMSMSRQGLMTSAFANSDPQQAAAQASQYAGTVAKLSALNPQYSPDQMIDVLRQASSGQARGMRYRLGIDPQDLARMQGVNQKDFTGNPELLMQAMGKYLDVYGKGLDSGRGDLISVVYEKLHDTLSVALQKVGESGVYDEVTDRLKAVMGGLMDYLNSSQFAGRAQELSKSVAGIFDGLGESMLRLIQAASGASSLANTPDAIAKQLASVLGEISNWSRELPGIAASVGRELREVSGDISSILGAVHTVAHPIDAMHELGSRDSDERAGQRSALIAQRLNELGLSGNAVGYANVDPYQHMGPMGGETMDAAANRINGPRIKFDTSKVNSGRPFVDTSGVQAGARRLLAEQAAQALSDADISQLGNTDEVRWRLSQSIPGFEDRLTGAKAATGMNAPYRLPAGLNAQVDGIGKDVLEPNYAAKFHSLDLLAESISSWSGDADKLTSAFATARAKIKELSGDSSGHSAFDQIKNWRDSSAIQLSGTIDDLSAEQKRDPEHSRDIQDRIGALQSAMDKIVGGYQHELEALGSELREKTGNFGVQISQSVSKEGATYASQVLSAFAAGKTAVQQQVAALLAKYGLPANVGFDSIPLGQQQPFTDIQLRERLASIKELNPNAPSHDSIASILAGQHSTGSQDIAAMRDSLSQSQGTYAAAKKALSLNPDDQSAQQAAAQSGATIAKLSGEIQQLQVQNNGLAQSFVSVGNAAQNTLGNGLGKVLTDIETKTGNVRAAFTAMAKDMLNQFNELMSRQLFSSVFGQPDGQSGAGHGIGGLFGGLTGGLTSGLTHLIGPTGPFSGYQAPTPTPVDEVPIGAATGGVFLGGLRMLASGGVVKGGKGQLAIIAEGGLGADEAVVPLRNGFLPIGHDSSGFHAVLPGSGRIIPAAMFADGGVVGGGRGPAYSGLSGGNGSGSGMGDIHVHHTQVTQLDGKEIARQTYHYNRAQLKQDNLKMLGPGGDGRRALGRV